MKTLLISAILSLACLNSYAITDDGGGNEVTTINKELKQQLNKHMVAPIFCDTEMIGVVEASFVIDNNGQVKILSLKSENSALKEYVKRKLLKVKVSGNGGGFWKTTSLSFVFRKEE